MAPQGLNRGQCPPTPFPFAMSSAPTFCCSRSRSPCSARSEVVTRFSSSSRRPRAARSAVFLADAAATAAFSAGSPSPAPSSRPRHIGLPAQPGVRSSSSRLWEYGTGQPAPIPLASGLTVPVCLTLAARAHSSPGKGCTGAHRCREKTARSSELTACCRSAKRSGPWAGERESGRGQVPTGGNQLPARHGTAHPPSRLLAASRVPSMCRGCGLAAGRLAVPSQPSSSSLWGGEDQRWRGPDGDGPRYPTAAACQYLPMRRCSCSALRCSRATVLSSPAMRSS